MPIISVRNNKNIRWKRETQKTKKNNKDRKDKGEREAILKGWQLNDFVAHLS